MMSRILWKIKQWWARLRGHDTVQVSPTLVQQPNYAQYERLCILLSLDADKVRKGEQGVQDAEIGDVHQLGPKVLRICLTNPDAIPLDAMDKPAAEHYVATVAAHFFFQCAKQWQKEQQSLRTTLKSLASRRS